MTKKLSQSLIQQSDKESDTLALANYEQLKEQFLAGIDEDLYQEFMKGYSLLQNLQQQPSSGITYLGQQQVQVLQNLNLANGV